MKSSETSKKLPPIVFGSKGQEENVGLLNKAAPTGLSDLLEWDPDIVETLDDNFKHEVVYKLKPVNSKHLRDSGWVCIFCRYILYRSLTLKETYQTLPTYMYLHIYSGIGKTRYPEKEKERQMEI